MAQRRLEQGIGEWYLIASRGDMVLRVRPGLLLGETPSGELSFDRSCAQLELDIADDGGLVLSAVADYELEATGGARCREERLARHHRVEIRLLHNVLQLDTDFAGPAQASDTVEIRAVPATSDPAAARGTAPEPAEPDPGPDAEPEAEPPEQPAGSGEAAAFELASDVTEPEPRATEAASAPADDTPETAGEASEAAASADAPIRFRPEDLPSESADATTDTAPPPAAALRASRGDRIATADSPRRGSRGGIPLPQRLPPSPESQAQEADAPSMKPHTALPGVRAINRGTIAALVGLAVIGLALLLPALREDSAPPEATPSATEPAEAPALQTDADAIAPGDAVVTAPPVPPAPRLLPAIGTPSAGTPAGTRQLAQGPDQSPPASERAAGPPREPVDVPPAEPAARPPATTRTPGQTADAGAATRTPAAATPQPVPPDPAVVAALERTGAAATRLAGDLARRRDLLAADLALARGNLTRPPDSNAYALYNRVLTQDPRSAEARTGLQAVRQGLINRALAQLASGSLDDARLTLQAAADTGANPQLVADLGGEVDYRQRLVDARAGRFDALYPIEQLVATSQEPPRVPRSASGSVEVQFTVTMEGEVTSIAVLGDVADDVEQAVREAIGQWRFQPVLYNGRPVPVRSSVRFNFQN